MYVRTTSACPGNPGYAQLFEESRAATRELQDAGIEARATVGGTFSQDCLCRIHNSAQNTTDLNSDQTLLQNQNKKAHFKLKVYSPKTF